jgi:peptidoglycan/xylan/chitin deacetylase (PgdA/CDA1 family)
MRGLAFLAKGLILALSLTGCATAPQESAESATIPKLGFAAEGRSPISLADDGKISVHAPAGRLAGRTITVNRLSDIKLGPKEVVLTFDDGPMPGRTRRILDILGANGVKATFLMVGDMARYHPALVREVAARGHSIGTHTQGHANLRSMDEEAARAQIENGIKSVQAALGPYRSRADKFFRFPYLSDTAALRRYLALRNMVVLDADIDSKDYYPSSPDQVRQRTLKLLGARGSGIILFHDIHPRTAAMLPGFLAELRARGFKVVHIVPGGAGGGAAVATRVRDVVARPTALPQNDPNSVHKLSDTGRT